MRHTHAPLSRGTGGGGARGRIGAPAAGEMTPEWETRPGGTGADGWRARRIGRGGRERERPDDSAGRKEPEEE